MTNRHEKYYFNVFLLITSGFITKKWRKGSISPNIFVCMSFIQRGRDAILGKKN